MGNAENMRAVIHPVVSGAAAGLFVLLALSGCGGHTSTSVNPNQRIPVKLTAMTEVHRSGETSQWAATWTGGSAPYTVSWDFGGGADDIAPYEDTSVAFAESTWYPVIAATVYTVEVQVRDAFGASGTASTWVEVAPRSNTAPVIENVLSDSDSIVVLVSDADGDEITVTLSNYEGFTVLSSEIIADENGVAAFDTIPDDIFSGGASNVTITINDGWGGEVTITYRYDFYIEWTTPDTLYAIPLQDTVAVDEPVTIVVATSATAHPFQFMTGVGLVINDDARYVIPTFNYGAPGGAYNDADGIWSDITVDGGFLIPPDHVFGDPGPDPDGTLPPGTQRIDINISPFGGHDVSSAEGALFNLQFTFGEPGEKIISFQEFNGVPRTYYHNDQEGFTNRFWSNYEGATITVVEPEPDPL